MYAHILLPTDGSEVSERAAMHGVELAKKLGAKVTALTITAPWTAVAIGEVAIAIPEKEYEARAETNAWAYLNSVTDAAKAAGVSRNAIHLRDANPYQAIIKAAQDHGCDLIVMGSHGRRGLEGFLLGSEAQRVLTHTKVPVLVVR